MSWYTRFKKGVSLNLSKIQNVKKETILKSLRKLKESKSSIPDSYLHNKIGMVALNNLRKVLTYKKDSAILKSVKWFFSRFQSKYYVRYKSILNWPENYRQLPFKSQNINSEGNYLKNKVNDIVVWYEELTGMDEVRSIQNRVIEAQNNLIIAQKKRRKASRSLAEIQKQLKRIYSELETIARGEERYLQLITKEVRTLKEERRLQELFNEADRQERECFSFLSTALKDSHEKERAYAEKTKYLSLIGSIIGAVIGILGSSIADKYKMKELKQFLQDSIDRKTDFDNIAEKLVKQQIRDISIAINDISTTTADKLTQSEKHLKESAISLNKYNEERVLEINISLDNLIEQQKNDNKNIENMLEQQKYDTRIAFITIGIVLPILSVFVSKWLS